VIFRGERGHNRVAQAAQERLRAGQLNGDIGAGQEADQLLGALGIGGELGNIPAGAAGPGLAARRASRRQRDDELLRRVPIGALLGGVDHERPLAHERDLVVEIQLVLRGIVVVERGLGHDLVRVDHVVEELERFGGAIVEGKGVAPARRRQVGNIDVEQPRLEQAVGGAPHARLFIREQLADLDHVVPGGRRADALLVVPVLAVEEKADRRLVRAAIAHTLEAVPHVDDGQHGRQEVVPHLLGQDVIQRHQPARPHEQRRGLVRIAHHVERAGAGRVGRAEERHRIGAAGAGQPFVIDFQAGLRLEFGQHRIDGILSQRRQVHVQRLLGADHARRENALRRQLAGTVASGQRRRDRRRGALEERAPGDSITLHQDISRHSKPP